MFWSRYRLFHSLKAQTAVLYGGLLTLSFAVVFGIVCLYLYIGNQESADRRLNGIFSECEYEYLTGKEFVPDLLPVQKVRKIPKAVFQRIAGEMGGFQLFLAFRKVDTQAYTLFGTHDGNVWQLAMNAETGRVEKTRIGRSDRSAVFARKFTRESYGEGNRIYFLLFDKNGKLLARSPFSKNDFRSFRNYSYNRQSAHIQYSNLQGARWRIRMAYRQLLDGNLLVVGLNQHAADENLEKIVNVLLVTGLAVLALSVLGGWWIACRMTRGIENVGRAAARIANGDYSCRVPAGSECLETDRLIASFNEMTQNTEMLMQELRTFADDIVHDLRTPLTRIIGRSEVAAMGHPSREKLLTVLGDNTEDCRRMQALINQMLDIAKTESGAGILHKKAFDLGALLQRSAELFRMLAEQKQQTLSIELPTEPVILYADPARIQQLIGNLLDNAVKFTPEGGSVMAGVSDTSGEILLTVSDTGCGISKEECGKVFKRFYRADTSRNLPGNGLGLAMVQAVAVAHGGFVVLDSTAGKGSSFTVHFPKNAER